MIASILITLIAALHLYIMVLEMALWETPTAARAFGLSPETARLTKAMAGNQGLYNGFLAAGLIFGLWQGGEGFAFKTFFLLCIIVAGIYGAATVKRRILLIQTVPAGLALAALCAGI
ncbi:MAG: DUF1304 domain-containing protein [Paracoccus sp. (in: a-proteobacteria)]|uniref:DUF1304 domain-containing protein n=1 Tax=Paracoccus sp. TaxID=267 RepID=UPI0026E08FE8|nr:DUF1304 domain-containing protein [Paracoccus sp. (in: a-proteobacteria)]MDO5621994.1 DUF1304 domain-containing protein [Paracoccus sp. (in: a-proteobacteria)]